jgi:hypothetical protein
MRLSTQRSYELLAKHGCYATEPCDECGRLLDHLRYTGRETAERVAAGSAGATTYSPRPAKADGHENTGLRPHGGRQNDDKTRKDKERFEEESGVTENPPAASLKQKTYKRKKRLPRPTPLGAVISRLPAGKCEIRHQWPRCSNSDSDARSRSRSNRI